MINDTVIAQGSIVTNQILAQQLQQIQQMFQQATQVVQQKSPPPQMPPEVQASLQIAQMETQRKMEYDKATMGMKQQEMQTQAKLDAMEAQGKAQQQAFENQMAQSEVNAKALQDQLDAKLKLIMNKQDNDQHQMTEISKNHEDNVTNMNVKMAELQDQLRAKPEQDVELQREAMRIAGQIEIARINKEVAVPDVPNEGVDAKAIMDQLLATQTRLLEHMTAPKRIVRGPDGKAQGIELVV